MSIAVRGTTLFRGSGGFGREAVISDKNTAPSQITVSRNAIAPNFDDSAI